MAAMKIRRFPDPVLRRKSAPIKFAGDEERSLLDDMLETMYLNHGVGLAAPQVGVSKRAIVVDTGEGPLQLLNPAIDEKSGMEPGEEGCLSLPGIIVKVRRAGKIKYTGLDKNGKPVNSEAEGLLARAIQHEIDHLDGKLLIHYVNPIKKIILKKRLLSKKKIF